MDREMDRVVVVAESDWIEVQEGEEVNPSFDTSLRPSVFWEKSKLLSVTTKERTEERTKYKEGEKRGTNAI